MARIIILANSERDGARCIAGIDDGTREWIRPVSRTEQRTIPVHVAYKIELFSIVEIPLAKDRPKDRYQKENRFVESWDWKIVGSISPKKTLKYCEDASVILHSHTDRVEPKALEALPFEQWKSLQLIRAKVTFDRDTFIRRRWRARFPDGSGHHLDLIVTDPQIKMKLRKGDEVKSDCLLTISLGTPWAPSRSKPKLCYKLVAGVGEI